MALGPEALDTPTEEDRAALKKIEALIDGEIRKHSKKSSVVEVTVPDELCLTSRLKPMIRRLYLFAGWENVKFKGSYYIGLDRKVSP